MNPPLALIILSCLLPLSLALCNSGCKTCSGSTCSACYSTYYWDSSYLDCYYYCSGTVDYFEYAYGGKAVCKHNYSSSLSNWLLVQVLASVIPIVVVMFLAIICACVARKRRKARINAVGSSPLVFQNTSPIIDSAVPINQAQLGGYESYRQDQGMFMNPAYSNQGPISYGEPYNMQQYGTPQPYYNQQPFYGNQPVVYAN